MAKTITATYTPAQQQQIMSETDALVQKALDAQMKKYPGIVLGHQLTLTAPTAPMVVEHSGNTRKLTADKVAPPPEA